MAKTNLNTLVSNFRTNNQTGSGLLSKLAIGSNLYDIKDPAVEALASEVQSRLNELETHEWNAVSKGANDAKFATSVTQGTDGSITVNYGTIRDEALTDSVTTGQFVTSVSQTKDGVLSATKSAVNAENVVLSSSDFDATNVKAALEEALAEAMALKGTSADLSSAETIAAAKKYADEKVQQLAGEDWTENAKKVQDIIDELTNTDNGAWSTLLDKLEGMSVTAKGTQGEPNYRPANANPTVVEYVTAAIEDVNAANSEGIADLDAVVYGGSNGSSDSTNANTSYTNDTTSQVKVKITEVDGKLTGVNVALKEELATKADLDTLDAEVVKTVNDKTATNNAVTLYAGDIKTSSSDNTSVATQITNLNTNKANKDAIGSTTINNWSASYASETLTWTNTETTVYVPVTGKTL